MKKLLLSLAVVCGAFTATAQTCTPNQTWADTTDYGVLPDTIVNLPDGIQNQAYSTDLNFKVPAEVTAELDASGNFVGSPIQSFKVTGVDGLPTGYQYACNVASCQYPGGSNGCANVYGTTALTGQFDITINVDATVMVSLVPGFPPTPVTQGTSFSGYRIIVGAAGTIEQVISPIYVSPNPANDVITVSNINANMKASKVFVSNIEGKVIATQTASGVSNYTFDMSGVKAGVYFVNVAHASGVETVKFVKQ